MLTAVVAEVKPRSASSSSITVWVGDIWGILWGDISSKVSSDIADEQATGRVRSLLVRF